MSIAGRWVGHFFEWPCPGCGSVMQALQGPANDDDACCEKCSEMGKLVACGATYLAQEVLRLRRERDNARSAYERLTKGSAA